MVCARQISFQHKRRQRMCLIYVSKKWPKCAKNKRDERYIGTLVLCLLLYALCLCFTLSSTSFMLPNHHAPPSIAFLLLINTKQINIDQHVGLSQVHYSQHVKPSQRSTSQLKLIQLSQLRESKITDTNERDESLVNLLSKHAQSS